LIGLLYRISDVIRGWTLGSDLGRLGEDLAHRHLRRRGCTVVARNYRTASGSGEIDMIAWQGPTLVFVEVKTRSSAAFGEPDRAVDAQKRELLRRAAREYLRRADVGHEKARFDVVSIVLSRPPRIDWYPDAFAFTGIEQ
jgi:putative endonuclease